MSRPDTTFLAGSIPPIVTPFKNGQVDEETYVRLLEFQIANGTHGILVNGTTSEPSVLTVEERNRLVDVAVKTVRGRVPIVAATGSQSHAETVALTEHATKAGVNALLIVTPYYIRPSQKGLVAYYEDLGRRSPLPMMIYHIPGRAAVNVELSTLKEIVERVPTLVGIKHAVNDLGFVSQMISTFGPEFRVFVGLEEFSFPMMAVGACGLMNAVANVAPRRVADLANAVGAGDMARAKALHYDLFELNQAVFWDTNPIPMKYMMKRMGLLTANEHRLPLIPAAPELERRLDALMQRAGLL